jgi:tetratricopeptide (TPR) repeat protein
LFSRKLLVLSIAAYLGCCIRAHADTFADGCASYSSANYGKAKSQFIEAAKAKPKSWQAQYQLANTLLQLQEVQGAKQAYQKCLILNPDPQIKKHCETAIAFILNPPKPTPAAPVEVKNFRGSTRDGGSSITTGSGASSRSDDSHQGDQPDARQLAIDARKAGIMADAKRQVDSIKEEQQRAVEEANANSNHRWRNRETGERYTGMNSDEKTSLQREYEVRIGRLMEDARRRANLVTTP